MLRYNNDDDEIFCFLEVLDEMIQSEKNIDKAIDKALEGLISAYSLSRVERILNIKYQSRKISEKLKNRFEKYTENIKSEEERV